MYRKSGAAGRARRGHYRTLRENNGPVRVTDKPQQGFQIRSLFSLITDYTIHVI